MGKGVRSGGAGTGKYGAIDAAVTELFATATLPGGPRSQPLPHKRPRPRVASATRVVKTGSFIQCRGSRYDLRGACRRPHECRLNGVDGVLRNQRCLGFEARKRDVKGQGGSDM